MLIWGTPIQNQKPTIVIACSVTSRAVLVLPFYESEGRASIVGVEERVREQTSCPSTGRGTAGCRYRQRALCAATSIRSGDCFFGFGVTGFGTVSRHDLFIDFLLIIHTSALLTELTFDLSKQGELVLVIGTGP